MITSPKMKNKKDCGKTAITWALHVMTKLPYDWIYNQVLNTMSNGVITEKIFDDLDDNPSEHERIIEKLGYKFSLVEPITYYLFGKKCPSFRTIILIHFTEENKNDIENFVHGTMHQHWVVLNSVTDDKISVFLGDGKMPKEYSHKEMEKMIVSGFPNCVYVIGDWENNKSTGFFSKLYSKIINFVMKLFLEK